MKNWSNLKKKTREALLKTTLRFYRSQIAHLDMHHLVFGINFQIHSVISSPFLSRFTSSSTCQPTSLIISTLVIHHTFTLSCGVPQGSVLGPVLFLLYDAGVINLVEECGFSAHAYADDLQVYQHVSPAQSSELLEQMANCVSRVEA